MLLAGGFSGGQQFTADYLWAAPDFIMPEFSINLGLREDRDGDFWFSEFKYIDYISNSNNNDVDMNHDSYPRNFDMFLCSFHGV